MNRLIILAAILSAYSPSCLSETKLPASISITTWVGEPIVTSTSSIHMLVPKKAIFYEVMLNAAKVDPKNFDFKAVDDFPAHPGHFVTAIGGVEMNLTTNHYWMLYKLPKKPDLKHPPTNDLLSPVG